MLAEAELDMILRANFAPWVLDLGLVVVGAGARSAVLRLPYLPEAARQGGAMCGQATAAAVDTAAALAICSAAGRYGPIATTQLTTCYVRPLEADAIVTAEVDGDLARRTDVQITVTDATQGRTCAHARATYHVSRQKGRS